jgi:hypothetical protein
VIGAGAALGHYTTEGGYLYPGARTIQIDTNPRGLWQGLRTADLHVRADAKAAAEAILARLKQRGVSRTGFRTNEMAKLIAGDSPDSKEFPCSQHRRPAQGGARARPGRAEGLGGGGRRRPLLQHGDDPHEGPAGRALSRGQRFRRDRLGAARRDRHRRRAWRRQGAAGRGRRQPDDARAGARDRPPPGHPHADGHHERRRIRRRGPQVPRNGITDKEAMHGRGDLAAAATGFGLRGASVTQPGRMAPLFKEHQGANIGTLWDVHIDDLIPSRAYRRVHYGEA